MNFIYANYEAIMEVLYTLVVLFGLAVLSAFGLFLFCKVERGYTSYQRRARRKHIRHQDVRVPGAFRTRPYR